MYISRIVIRNFRNFRHFNVPIQSGITCIVGENNTGKTNLLHAIRLAVDANLSSQYRQLLDHDIHSGVDLTNAGQVLVSVEFRNYQNAVNECALLGCCEVDADFARIHYRYRPKREVRDAIAEDTRPSTGLSISEDYHFELTGGGAADPATVNWNENLGAAYALGTFKRFKLNSYRHFATFNTASVKLTIHHWAVS